MEFGVNKRVLVLVILMGIFVRAYSKPVLTDSTNAKKFRSTFYLKPLNLVLLNASGAYEIKSKTSKRDLRLCIPFSFGINSKKIFIVTRKIYTLGVGLKWTPFYREKNVFIYPLIEFGQIYYAQENYMWNNSNIGNYYDKRLKAYLGIASFSWGKRFYKYRDKVTIETLVGCGLRFQNIKEGSKGPIDVHTIEHPLYPIIKAGLNIGFNF